MSDSLARALAAPAPAAQPFGNQDMLARILMGTPDPGLPQYPGFQSAEGRGFAPLPTSMGDMGARMGAVLRGQVEPTPGERYGMDVPLGWVAGSGGSARDGIRAYHGSPYQFDRFDMSRIGTGEGAQAYGHGLYFAGNEGVARSYRDKLSPSGHPQTQTFNAFGAAFPAGEAAIDGIYYPSARSLMDAYHKGYVRPDQLPESVVQAFDRIARPGSMYEVRLNTTPDRLLDWDAPLNRQPQEVRDALARVPWGDAYVNSNLTGGQIMPRTAEGAQQLREAGIPGIQYFDAGSRATAGGELLGITQGPQGWQAKIRVDNRGGVMFADPTQQITTSRPFASEAEAQAWALSKIGDGTRNYVMFDDKLIDILRRYGLAGMLAGGAASQAQAGEPAP